MNTLIVLRGLPASGKTTFARSLLEKDSRIKRVNKDDLRAMIDFGKYSPKNEDFIVDCRDAIVRTALSQGFSVVVDDTNLHHAHVTALQEIATSFGCQFELIDMDTSLAECLDRDSKRPSPVGKGVILGMYKSHGN